MEPLFITLEGLDGSGKSTQLRHICRWLEDRSIGYRVTQEPGGTPLGESIRSVFLREKWEPVDGTVEALLIFASRRQHLIEVIDPALAAGRQVICDRFTDSTLAYQGYGRGVSLPTIRRVDELATESRRPDYTLLFDLPAELARTRGQSPGRRSEPGGVDRLDAEDLGFYERVRAGFLELAQAEPKRFYVIDSSGSIAATRDRVMTILEELYGETG